MIPSPSCVAYMLIASSLVLGDNGPRSDASECFQSSSRILEQEKKTRSLDNQDSTQSVDFPCTAPLQSKAGVHQSNGVLPIPSEMGHKASPALEFSAMVAKLTTNGKDFDEFTRVSAGCSSRGSFANSAQQLYETLFFICLQGSQQRVPRVKLGFCSNPEDLFEKIADSAEIPVQSIKKLAIRLPADIGRLEKYVLEIGAGDQEAFDLLIKTISSGMIRFGATVPRRYILRATVVCSPSV